MKLYLLALCVVVVPKVSSCRQNASERKWRNKRCKKRGESNLSLSEQNIHLLQVSFFCIFESDFTRFTIILALSQKLHLQVQQFNFLILFALTYDRNFFYPFFPLHNPISVHAKWECEIYVLLIPCDRIDTFTSHQVAFFSKLNKLLFIVMLQFYMYLLSTGMILHFVFDWFRFDSGPIYSCHFGIDCNGHHLWT